LEFTVEPFVDAQPGEHVQAAWRAVEGRGYQLTHGPFSSEATVSTGEAPSLIQEILRAALWGGASHVSFQVDVIDDGDGP
jgi:uncharacterized protein YqgV (UPF0045/DUF77 family)